MTEMTTAQRGEIALLHVLARAVEKGWLASRPTLDCRYDLILDDGNKLHRVQVKYVARKASHGTVGSVALQFTKGGRYKGRGRYSQNDVDAILVYVVPANVIVWLGPELFHNRTSINLRYEPSSHGRRIGCVNVTDLIW